MASSIFAQVLIHRARELYAKEPLAVDMGQTACDTERQKRLVFITNNFALPALMIAPDSNGSPCRNDR